MSQIKVNKISPTSPAGTVDFSGSNPPTYNGLPLVTTGSITIDGGPLSGYQDPRPIQVTPPAPTNLTAHGAFRSIILTWDLENYINHAYVQIYRANTNDRNNASLIGTSTADVFSDANGLITGNTYYYWVRAVNIEGTTGTYSNGITSGVSAGLLQIAGSDLSNLAVEASKLADGSITTAKLAPGAISSFTQFASSLEPISVVNSLPSTSGYTGPKLVFLTTDGKLYRYTGGAWVKAVATTDLTGTISNSQLATGIDASKLSGTLDVARIAAGALDATKFAASIEPITIVSSVPGTKSTNTIYDSTTRKLYRWNGSAYVSTVNASDIAGGLTNSQIQDLDASKLTGTINSARIAAGTLDATKFASSIEPVTLVTSIPITKSTSVIYNTTTNKFYRWDGISYVSSVDSGDLSGPIDGSLIINGTVSSTKFASSIEPITLVSSVPGAKVTNLIFNTTDGKLYRWEGGAYTKAISGTDIIGTINASLITDGTISETKFASSVQPIKIVNSIPGSFNGSNVLYLSTDGKVYRWNGTAYTTSVFASDITVGTITTTQIQDGAITTPKMTANSINADRLTAGTITTNLMTANSINGDRITSNTIDAGKIIAASITATQLAAGSITAAKIASLTITGDKIAANTLTGDKIQANSVTGDRITSNTLDAGKIVSGSITATQLAASSITSDKIAASAITGDKIAANAITSTKILAGSITGDRLQSGTVTAGQIQAGAIGASEIAAGAITVNKLAVSNPGPALNTDPTMTDLSGWTLYTGTAFSSVTVADGIAGTKALEVTNSSSSIDKSFPITTGKQYRITGYVRKLNGTGTIYIRIITRDSSNTIVTSTVNDIFPGNLGAGGKLENITLPNSTTWTKFIGSITAPSTAVLAQLQLYGNFGGTGVTQYQNVRVYEAIESELLVDGSITTEKMNANSINGDRILANSLSAAKLIAGSITTDRFSANSIGGTVLQDGSISANKLIANSITSAQIQAGAIGADQIASKSISVSKLIVANQDSVIPDPTWSDRGWFTNNSPVIPNIYGESAWPENTSWPIQHALKFDGSIVGGTGDFNFETSKWPIELGGSYRAKVYIYATPDIAGTIAINMLFPEQSLWDMSIPRTGTNSVRGVPNIDLASLTKNAWNTFVGTFTNASNIILQSNVNNYSQLVFSGNLTSGTLWFGIELVRANTADLIVDGAITTNKMTANSINGDRIATNTLNADRILSNSITSGKIAAGAITSAQIAANAITTDKLVVTGKGLSINDDPGFSDTTAWIGASYDIVTITDGIAGNKAVRSNNFGGTCSVHTSKTYPIDTTKTFKIRAKVRKSATANGSFYLVVDLLDTNNNRIARDGTYWYYPVSNGIAGTSFTEYTGTFGVGQGANAFPSNARFMRPALLLNYQGTAGYYEAQDLRLEEMIGNDLIVDGSIIASKLAANSIAVGTAAIQNGAITNAMLGNAIIDNAKIVDATISSAKIASVNASTISTGTLSADRIAGGSISADKLNVDSNVTLNSNGAFRAGKTTFSDNTSGFWLGVESNIPKLKIGNPTKYLEFDSSVGDLVLSGQLITEGNLVSGAISERITGGLTDTAVATWSNVNDYYDAFPYPGSNGMGMFSFAITKSNIALTALASISFNAEASNASVESIQMVYGLYLYSMAGGGSGTLVGVGSSINRRVRVFTTSTGRKSAVSHDTLFLNMPIATAGNYRLVVSPGSVRAFDSSGNIVAPGVNSWITANSQSNGYFSVAMVRL